MSPIVVTREINAPIDVVFRTVAHIEEFAKVQPQIVDVAFLTEQRTGVGTQFRETRMMKGKEAETELEVTEYRINESIRLIADSHGAVWDTVFEVSTQGDKTLLTMTMEARPYQFMQRLMLPLIRSMICKLVVKDMDRVKLYCEDTPGE